MHEEAAQPSKEKGSQAVSSSRSGILSLVWFKELFDIRHEPDQRAMCYDLIVKHNHGLPLGAANLAKERSLHF